MELGGRTVRAAPIQLTVALALTRTKGESKWDRKTKSTVLARWTGCQMQSWTTFSTPMSKTFICFNCGKEFETERSDEEAWAEFVKDFPTQAANVAAGIDQKAEICEGCYQSFSSWISTQFRGLTQ